MLPVETEEVPEHSPLLIVITPASVIWVECVPFTPSPNTLLSILKALVSCIKRHWVIPMSETTSFVIRPVLAMDVNASHNGRWDGCEPQDMYCCKVILPALENLYFWHIVVRAQSLVEEEEAVPQAHVLSPHINSKVMVVYSVITWLLIIPPICESILY
jgi:hypothetical protein